MEVVDLPCQLRNFRTVVMQPVFQLCFVVGTQPAHGKIHQAVDGLCLGFLCGREPGAGFADMRGMALAGKFLISLVFAANLAVVSLRMATLLFPHNHISISNVLTVVINSFVDRGRQFS